MEEIILVKRAIKGDRKAFEELIHIYSDRLYREAYIRCKHEDDAKEIIQETIYKAYRNISSLKEPKYFKTWISRILINTSNDYISKIGMIDLEHDESSYIKEIIVDDKIETKIDLYNAIDELEDKYKDAIILRYIHDMKIEEVSKVLNRPINTIKTHLRKAIFDMKNLLKEGYSNE
ncbi:sigma-70 family RNA polymerase sigma factor [Romboutsia sp. Marseille-P6047]|uniref:sigma-70 family RNA polymerase sigma factor n=1 Tax=Romboutsia sp. Marseille-P6047 TaxID=2161817 RepID=UPI0008231CBC|nr:sigma-70 family RNA polymerase sigma factor [Romboutsia sp. Marseille-P6047]SCH53175.1 RNA polymerase sigma factor sigV [uncultured Clostridium sp.]